MVTGSSGFVGRHLVNALLEQGTQVMSVDTRNGADLRMRETLKVIARFDPEAVFHLAAHHYIPWCNEHPRETLDVNVNATIALCEALKSSISLRSFVLASSAAVYGLADEPGAWFTEESPIRPADVYGRSKVAAEEVVRELTLRRPATFRGVAARLSNVVGAGDATPHLIPAAIRAALAGEPLRHGNLLTRRSFVHVLDVTRALLGLERAPGGGFQARNVSSGVGSSGSHALWTVAGALRSRDLPDLVLEPGEPRGVDGHLVLSSRLLESETGWRPELDLAQGALDAVDWEVTRDARARR